MTCCNNNGTWNRTVGKFAELYCSFSSAWSLEFRISSCRWIHFILFPFVFSFSDKRTTLAHLRSYLCFNSPLLWKQNYWNTYITNMFLHRKTTNLYSWASPLYQSLHFEWCSVVRSILWIIAQLNPKIVREIFTNYVYFKAVKCSLKTLCCSFLMLLQTVPG